MPASVLMKGRSEPNVAIDEMRIGALRAPERNDEFAIGGLGARRKCVEDARFVRGMATTWTTSSCRGCCTWRYCAALAHAGLEGHQPAKDVSGRAATARASSSTT
jgi:hypothetical protein